MYSVKASPASACKVISVSVSRYSIFTASPLVSEAVISTLWVFLKNRSKVILFRKLFHRFVSTWMAPVGG